MVVRFIRFTRILPTEVFVRPKITKVTIKTTTLSSVVYVPKRLFVVLMPLQTNHEGVITLRKKQRNQYF